MSAFAILKIWVQGEILWLYQTVNAGLHAQANIVQKMGSTPRSKLCITETYLCFLQTPANQTVQVLFNSVILHLRSDYRRSQFQY